MKKKFGCAFAGLKVAFGHPSVRLQMFLGALTILAGLFLKLSRAEWQMVIVCIFCVITAEMFNTCIELICDMHTKQYDPQVKRIKDLSAGCVLVISIMALIEAVMILLNHIGL